MGDFYNGGLLGNFSFFVGSNWNFVSGYIKIIDTHHETFSSKKQVIKKVIAQKPLTNLYEMNSSSHYGQARELLVVFVVVFIVVYGFLKTFLCMWHKFAVMGDRSELHQLWRLIYILVRFISNVPVYLFHKSMPTFNRLAFHNAIRDFHETFRKSSA